MHSCGGKICSLPMKINGQWLDRFKQGFQSFNAYALPLVQMVPHWSDVLGCPCSFSEVSTSTVWCEGSPGCLFQEFWTGSKYLDSRAAEEIYSVLNPARLLLSLELSPAEPLLFSSLDLNSRVTHFVFYRSQFYTDWWAAMARDLEVVPKWQVGGSKMG